MGKPMAVPRSHGFHERFQSSRVIHFPEMGTRGMGPRRSREATCSASPTAKKPTATMTTSMPSASVGRPRVKRCWPVRLSVPMTAMNSPRASEAMPRAGEAPSIAATVKKASTARAT